MGRPERAAANEAVHWAGTHHGGDDGRLAGLVVVERREEAGDRGGEHRLARARRADEDQPVPAGEGDLEGSPRLELAADVGQVRDLAGPIVPGRLRQLGRDQLGAQPGMVSRDPAAPQRVRGLGQRGGADHVDPRHEAGLSEGVRRHHHAAGSATGERRDHRQDARYRAHLPAQPELTEERPRPPGLHLLGADEDRHRDAEIQGRAGLRDVRRGEVHRDAARGMDKPAVAQGATNALAGLAQGGVGKADDREAGQSRGHVGLHPDGAAVDAVEGGGEDACEHGPHGSDRRSPPDYPPLISSTPRRRLSGLAP
ncbi:MAG TPA: hypothetical protein VLM76_13130 [Patescibacteria group bacterium]|nr:hypothetical protein [Patescibacteria group bacterium]